jgi:hypothetical protein
MPFDKEFDGAHDHSVGNPGGLHTHPSLGITEMGGVHDHGIDFWGIHLHRAADGRMQVHAGGMHLHDFDMVDGPHIHSVLGAIGRDGLPMDIEVTKSEGTVLVRKATHEEMNEEAEADLFAKGVFHPEASWAILYTFQDIPGCYMADFAKAEYGAVGEKKKGPKHAPKSTRVEAEKVAKQIAVVMGEAVLAKVRASADGALVVERVQTYKVDEPVVPLSKVEEQPAPNVEALTPPPLTIPQVHSLNLFKSEFRNVDAAKVWVQKNGFSSDTMCELHDSWVFLQNDNGGPVREHIIDTGLIVNVQKTESVEREVPFAKIDKAKQMVEGVVYEPWVIDSHGDWMHPDDIEKAAHDFMRHGRQGNIDAEHDENVLERCEAVESFLAPAGHPHYTEGAWVVKTHIRAEEIWKAVLDGTFNGYSMAGRATRLRGEPPPSDRANPLFLKGEGEEVEIAKDFLDDDDDLGGVRKRRGNRLTDVSVHYLSLVNKGANGRDFKFRKNADGDQVVIYKSRSLQLIDGDCPVNIDGPFVKLMESIKARLGFGGDTSTSNDSGPLVVPEQERMEPVSKNAGLLTLMAGMAYVAKRAADSERALVALAKSKELSPAIQADPTLQGILAGISKAGQEIDLTKFAVGMADFMEQQGNNGMNLPGAQDFTGHVQQFFDSPGRFLQGFPDKVESTGSFSGQSGQALSKSDVDGVEVETVVDATQPVTGAEADKRAGEMTVEALMASDDEVLKRSVVEALSKKKGELPAFLQGKKGKDKDKKDDDKDMAKTIAEAVAAAVAPLAAEIKTISKAQNGNADEPAQTEGLAADTAPAGDPGAFVAFTDNPELEEDVRKSMTSGTVTSKNPFGGSGDALGIRVDGGGTALMPFATNRQRGNG